MGLRVQGCEWATSALTNCQRALRAELRSLPKYVAKECQRLLNQSENVQLRSAVRTCSAIEAASKNDGGTPAAPWKQFGETRLARRHGIDS